MNFFNKILYDEDTGNVLLIKGEVSGGIKDLTLDEEIQANPFLQGKKVGIYQLAPGEKEEELKNVGSMKVIEGQLIIYPRLTISTDKTQIASDGVDTAIITSGHAETFCVDGGEDYTVNPFQFASNVLGVYTITAKSTLYGQNSLTIEVI